ncbi:hypothetical protein BJX64DRAFT_272103 [Aspergillus heterothallicus]
MLLSPEDGINKDSLAEYSEPGADGTDCRYKESVVVHDAADYGTNYLVNVVKTQELRGFRALHYLQIPAHDTFVETQDR